MSNLLELEDVWQTRIPCLGLMGLAGTWNPSEIGDHHREAAVDAFTAALDSGYAMFDHADIYARGSCEDIFRYCMEQVKPDRSKLYIANKCGIRLEDSDGPFRYDLSYDHIMFSIEHSLKRTGLDYFDLYQVHRRDPKSHPVDTARALNELKQQGLIRHIGVSNYVPSQIHALQEYLHEPIVSVQSELNLFHLDPMLDGLTDYCEQNDCVFLAYSPIKKGMVIGRNVSSELQKRAGSLLPELHRVSALKNATLSQVALAWLRHFPFKVISVYGSNNADHIKDAAQSASLELTHVEWYQLWRASRAEPLP